MRCSPKRARQAADQPALHHHQHDADIEEETADLLRAPAEAAIRPKRESGLHPGEGDRRQEEQDNKVPELRPGEGVLRQRQAAGPRRGAAILRRQTLLQQDDGEDQRDRREDRRRKGRARQRRRAGIRAGEQPADRRAEGEAQAEGRADHAHALGAVLLGGDVGDIGLRRRDIAGPGPRQQPRREQHPERIGETEPEIREHRAGQADQQHRPAADPVREPAPDRRSEELREGIARHHRRHLEWRGREFQRVVRQQRDHDPEADQIDEDDEEEDSHCGTGRSLARIHAARQRDSG